MIIQSKKYRFLAFVAAALFSLASPKALAQSGPPAGQQPSEEAALNALADGAVKALQSGDYATAAAKFEAMRIAGIHISESPAALGSTMLAALRG